MSDHLIVRETALSAVIHDPASGVWNNGRIQWALVSADTNVVEVSTNVNAQGTLYWWRNELQGESLHDALRQFYEVFPFGELKTNVASIVANEFDSTDQSLIQSHNVTFTTQGCYLYEGE